MHPVKIGPLNLSSFGKVKPSNMQVCVRNVYVHTIRHTKVINITQVENVHRFLVPGLTE